LCPSGEYPPKIYMCPSITTVAQPQRGEGSVPFVFIGVQAPELVRKKRDTKEGERREGKIRGHGEGADKRENDGEGEKERRRRDTQADTLTH
jgi:hypothetical protein